MCKAISQVASFPPHPAASVFLSKTLLEEVFRDASRFAIRLSWSLVINIKFNSQKIIKLNKI